MRSNDLRQTPLSLLHESNRDGWDAAAKGRYSSELATRIDKMRAGETSLLPIELALLRPLVEDAKSAVQLQCADGRDIISIQQLGISRVAGVDISQVMIGLARQLANAVGVDATWIVSDIVDVTDHFQQPFDLVYTGKGSLMWMLDIQKWAYAVADILAPGGHLVVYDLHPVVALFRQDATTLRPSGINYFDFVNATRRWPESYVGELTEVVESPKFERLWPLSAIVTALLTAGLKIEHLGEHPDAYWDAYPLLPADIRASIPKTFSLVASKPSR